MAGNQFGFIFHSDQSIYDFYGIVRDRLEEYFKDYNLIDDDIVYVELSFKKFNTKLFSEFSIEDFKHKDPFIEISNLSENKLLNIPISVSEDYLGKPLDLVINNNIITNIPVTIDGTKHNFLDIIKSKTKLLRAKHKDNITVFDSGFKFYLLRDTTPYVLAVKYKDDSFVEKIRYSINGVIINHVVDSKDNNMVIRKSGEKEIIFENNKPISMKQNILLKSIEKPRKNTTLFVNNPNIGVIDTETFTSSDGTQKIYALGFKTNLAEKAVIYYINKDDLDSSKIVLDLINELLRPKYDKTSFYCHNLSGYDIVFILKILCSYNDANYDKYTIRTILRNDRIIKATISKDKHSFSILDSYAILPESLHRLGINFEVSIPKTTFPYKFAYTRQLILCRKYT